MLPQVYQICKQYLRNLTIVLFDHRVLIEGGDRGIKTSSYKMWASRGERSESETEYRFESHFSEREKKEDR